MKCNAIVVFLIITVASRNVQITFADPVINYLYKVNEALEDTVNKLFISLSISTKFTETNKVKIFLAMHKSSRNISERNYETFKETYISSRADKSLTENAFFNFTKVMNELFEVRIVDENPNGDTNKQNFFSRNLKYWPGSNSTLNSYRRLYGGTQTRIESYPFVASFHMLGDFICSGSIVAAEFILTAASCLQLPTMSKSYRTNPRAITARVGSDYSSKDGIIALIASIHFHPKYDPHYLSNNVALVKLTQRLPALNTIRAIECDTVDSVMEHDTVTLLGWGDENDLVIDNHQPISMDHIDVYKHDTCRDIYTSKFVNNNNFCAGYENQKSGACNRDVGGPAIINNRLVGVVSYGPPVCGTANAPTVFSKVGLYASWINKVTRNNEKIVVIIKKTPETTTTTHDTHANSQSSVLKEIFDELIRSGDLNLKDILGDDGTNEKLLLSKEKISANFYQKAKLNKDYARSRDLDVGIIINNSNESASNEAYYKALAAQHTQSSDAIALHTQSSDTIAQHTQSSDTIEYFSVKQESAMVTTERYVTEERQLFKDSKAVESILQQIIEMEKKLKNQGPVMNKKHKRKHRILFDNSDDEEKPAKISEDDEKYYKTHDRQDESNGMDIDFTPKHEKVERDLRKIYEYRKSTHKHYYPEEGLRRLVTTIKYYVTP